MASFRLSASAIGAYDWCPKKFKLQYIDKEKSDVEVPHLIKGKEIHAYFEDYYNSLDTYDTITEKTIVEHAPTISEEKYLKYKEHIDNFVDFNKNVFVSLEDGKKIYFKPVAVEEKLYDENLNLVGVIDAVYTDGDNVLVLDYKTGKASTSIAQYRNQLAGYKHLWDMFNPEMKATHWGIFFSGQKATNKNPLIEKANDKHMVAMYDKLETTRQLIEKEVFPETKNTWACQHCDLFAKCKGLLC